MTVQWIAVTPIESIPVPTGSFLFFILIHAFCNPLEAAEVVRCFQLQIDEYVMLIARIRGGSDQYGIEFDIARAQYAMWQETLFPPGPQESVHVSEFFIVIH